MKLFAYLLLIFTNSASGSLLLAEDLKASTSLTKNTPTVSEMTDLANDFLDNLQGEFVLDPLRTERVGKYTIPTLLNGDWMLTNHPKPLVDTFAARTNSEASIYVKMGDDFVIVSTSLKRDQKTDLAGTILDQATPAYQNLIKGKRYTGKMVLFNKTYMADFDLIRDADGNVLGAYFIGIP